jgi:hypothetical protein
MGQQSHTCCKKRPNTGEFPMLDYDRLAALSVCLGLLGLFAAAFNLETVLASLRKVIRRQGKARRA